MKKISLLTHVMFLQQDTVTILVVTFLIMQMGKRHVSKHIAYVHAQTRQLVRTKNVNNRILLDLSSHAVTIMDSSISLYCLTICPSEYHKNIHTGIWNQE